MMLALVVFGREAIKLCLVAIKQKIYNNNPPPREFCEVGDCFIC